MYGTTTAYGSASSSASLLTSHSISLTGLSSGATYHYAVVSADAQGNTATSSDQTFATGSVTFNPSDKTAAITLSNGNLTAASNNGSAVAAVRSTTSHSSGKYHVESTIDNAPNSGDWGIGIAGGSHSYSSYCGSSVDTRSLCLYGSGLKYFNGSSSSLFSTPFGHNGDVIAMEVDFDNNLIWFKDVTTGSNWNNSSSANPATEVGGVSISSVTGGPFFFIAEPDDTNAQVTVNVGASVYAQTPSTGFLNWDGSDPNGIYGNFTLSYSDDFTGSSVSAVGPSTPNASYFMTRGYGGPTSGIEFRGTFGTVSDPGYMTDPFHTGYNDYNRNVAVGYSNVRQSSSILTLQARAATNAEKNTFTDPTNVQNVDAILSTDGAVGFFPATNASIIVEGRMRFTAAGSAPLGWNPAFWITSNAPTVFDGHDEWHIFEAFDSSAQLNVYLCSASNTCSYSTTAGTWSNSAAYDGNYHTYSIVLNNNGSNNGPVYVYLDGVRRFTVAKDANASLLPMYFMIDSWFASSADTFNQTLWNNSGTLTTSGASVDVDWVKVWRQNGLPNYTPMTSVSDLQLAYNGAGSIVLPSAATLWGDSSLTEYVQCRPMESNEPGTNATSISYR